MFYGKRNYKYHLLLTFSLFLIITSLYHPAYASTRGYRNVAAGQLHTIALSNDGNIFIWGNNFWGQLGDGTNVSKDFPIAVEGISNVAEVECGNVHSLVLKRDGTVWAWGANVYGQIGDGTSTNRNYPVKVKNLSNIISISGGYNYSMALDKNGDVWAWGNNDFGQLGIGSNEKQLVPVKVNNLTEIKRLDCGGDHNFGVTHSLALRSDGTVWSWGDNSYGQLGNNSNKSSDIPVQVENLKEIVMITAGGGYSLALKSDGTVWEWGISDYAGNGYNLQDNLVPTAVTGMTDVVSIYTGELGAIYAVKKDGTIWTWGSYFERLIHNTVPVKVEFITNVNTIAVGIGDTFAVKKDGTVWAWGTKSKVLADGSALTTKYFPVEVIDNHIPPLVHIKLFLNSRNINSTKGSNLLQVAPYINSGRTMIPLRFISESLGAKVLWNEKEQKITIVGDKNITMWIGENRVIVDNEVYETQPKPELKNNVTFVPLRFVSEILGAKVIYNADEQSIEIVRANLVTSSNNAGNGSATLRPNFA